MKRASRRRLMPLLLVLAVLATGAGPKRAGEYEVKAAFLYNFTKFVDWPEASFSGSDGPFVLAVLGDDPFGKALDEVLEGKRVGKRPLVIRRHETLEELKDCHLLFVADDFEKGVQDVLDRLGSAPTLTVGEFEDCVKRGVVIGFRNAGRKVRFDINGIAADARSLKISSRLLALAGEVIGADER